MMIFNPWQTMVDEPQNSPRPEVLEDQGDEELRADNRDGGVNMSGMGLWVLELLENQFRRSP